MGDELTYEMLEAGNVLDSVTVGKYKVAAEIANGKYTYYLYSQSAALAKCALLCTVGSFAADICTATNAFITSETVGIFQKCERGVAFPCCLSVNHVVQNFSPLEALDAGVRSDLVLCNGDIVKIELGVHVDGYVATNAITVVVSETPAKEALNGPAANANYASEVAAKLIRPGKSSFEVAKAIQRVAQNFHCQPCQQTATFITQRYIIEGDNKIDNQTIIDNKPIVEQADMTFESFDFEFDQVYSVNIIMSSGKGLTRLSPGHSTQVMQRDVNVTYPLKMKTSRTALSELTAKFSVFPFACRDLFAMNKQHMHGIKECLEHRCVVGLPVLEEMDRSAFVAQYKFGILLTRNGAIRLTSVGQNGLALPFVHSVYELDADLLDIVKAEDAKVNGVAAMEM